MKRTEQMNIGGLAFNVEEDATAILGEYLESIRDEYSSDASCNEICSDIEERIGELLSERCSDERIVNAGMVRAVKATMGDFGEKPEPEAPGKGKKRKRIFRDIDNRNLGGVLSGLNSHDGIGRLLLIVCGSMMILWGAGSIIGCTVFDMIPRIVRTYVGDPDVTSVINTIFSTKVTVMLIVTTVLFAIWSIYVGVTLIFDIRAPKWRPGMILFILFIIAAITFGVFAARAALQIPLLFGTMTV